MRHESRGQARGDGKRVRQTSFDKEMFVGNNSVCGVCVCVCVCVCQMGLCVRVNVWCGCACLIMCMFDVCALTSVRDRMYVHPKRRKEGVRQTDPESRGRARCETD